MGWASATYIMQNVISAIKESPRFKDDFEARKEVYKVVYKELEAGDWDCQDEPNGMDPAYDQLLKDEGIDLWSDEDDE